MVTLEKIKIRLAEAIHLSGLRQVEIAAKLNISQPTVAQYLSGRALPSLDTFAKLCEILDVDPTYILGLTD